MMTTPDRLKRRQRTESLFMGVLALALAASFFYFRDQSERQLECFDQYAAADSATSVIVREASAARDQATMDRDAAFNALFRFIATDPADEDPRGLELFTALSVANGDLVTAQEELETARAENPVPEPPSKFCDD